MIGTVSRILFALLLLATTAAHARAEEKENANVRPGGHGAFERTVADLVLERLAAAPAPHSEREAQERVALRIFYSILDTKPLWTDEDGLNARARAAAAEIAQAKEYGLDPADYALPRLEASDLTKGDIARAELAFSLAVLKYVRHAKGGRAEADELGQLHDPPELPQPYAVLSALSASNSVDAYLRALHPDHPQFKALQKKLTELRAGREEAAKVEIPPGPVLRRGDAHAQVALLRERFDVPAGNGKNAKRFDEDVEAALKEFQKKNGLKVDGILGPGTRRALRSNTGETLILKILVNMERWRWLPDDLDAGTGIYVWANVPEFRVRVIRNGETVFSEKAIVGKVNKQTPIFSDEMEWIAFHPTWYVPNSIKVADILPSLRRPTSTVMERYNLRLDCGRHGRDPDAINWRKVDIRNCSISQPPGPKSVLGDFKFKFPNRHAVYMHDTPKVSLFKAEKRTFSHGCIRVQNPRRMAEILLDHDKGMRPERIGEILDGPVSLHKEEFNRPVPVHITYFTTVIGDNGEFLSRPDYYGRDRRLANALTGRGDALPTAYTPQRPARVSDRRPEPASWQDGFWRRVAQ